MLENGIRKNNYGRFPNKCKPIHFIVVQSGTFHTLNTACHFARSGPAFF